MHSVQHEGCQQVKRAVKVDAPCKEGRGRMHSVQHEGCQQVKRAVKVDAPCKEGHGRMHSMQHEKCQRVRRAAKVDAPRKGGQGWWWELGRHHCPVSWRTTWAASVPRSSSTCISSCLPCRCPHMHLIMSTLPCHGLCSAVPERLYMSTEQGPRVCYLPSKSASYPNLCSPFYGWAGLLFHLFRVSV